MGSNWVQKKPKSAPEGDWEGVSPMLVGLLATRGIDSADKAQAFLKPSFTDLKDPFLFKDMTKACNRLVLALERQETIGVFGDYDVDGTSSTALLVSFLRGLGATVAFTIPDRFSEGYGMSLPGIERLQTAGASLIVSVDCGSTSHVAIEQANDMGLEVIVVDHHKVPETHPKAFAFVNPCREDCGRFGEQLCAAGVTFNVCMALRKILREKGFFKTKPEPKLTALLDLVALATVADVMPLVEDNRIFVHFGLRVLQHGGRPGLRALLAVAGVTPEKIKASTFGFQIGPRINAAGRLEDANLAVNLLLEEDPEQAMIWAKELDVQNQERRQIQEEIIEEAVKQVESSPQMLSAKALVLGSPSWHPGVVGIVASRLVELYSKPALVIGKGGKGSGRSIPAFHLHDALGLVRDYFLGFGGHAHAVGVSLDLERLGDLRAAFCAVAAEKLSDSDIKKTHYYDQSIQLEEINDALIGQLERLAPFGRGNPEPVFKIEDLSLTETRVLKDKHLKGQVTQGRAKLDFIAFSKSEKQHLLGSQVSLLASPSINEFRGKRSLQLMVKDLA